MLMHAPQDLPKALQSSSSTQRRSAGAAQPLPLTLCIRHPGTPPPHLLRRRDYNQKHFVRSEGFQQAADKIQGPMRRIFIEFLERSCTAGGLPGLAWLGLGVVGASRIGGQVGAVELSCRGAALPPAPSSLPIRRLLLTQSPSPLPAPRRVLRLPAVQGAGPPPAEEQPGGGGDLHPAGPRRGTPRRLHQQGALW